MAYIPITVTYFSADERKAMTRLEFKEHQDMYLFETNKQSQKHACVNSQIIASLTYVRAA